MTKQSLARTLVVVSAMLLAMTTTPLRAQDYPNKPVTIILPYAAGGGADALARTIGRKLQDNLGQPFVIENKPGAGGILASDMVAKSRADGYTLLLTDTQYVITPALFSHLSFDPRKDLKGVSLMTVVPLYIAVKTSSNIDSLQQLIALVKANPGKYSYGSAGVGSLHHIAMESFKHSLNLDMTHVPYKGSGQSVEGFLAGDVQVLIASLPAILPYIKDGKVKLLGTTSLHRSEQMPDVPAISDVIPGYDFATEIGMLAPAATPPKIVAKIADAIAKSLKDPDTIQRITNVMGATAVGSTPEAYSKNLAQNFDRYATAVKISGAKVE